jgi:hypothetical protein
MRRRNRRSRAFGTALVVGLTALTAFAPAAGAHGGHGHDGIGLGHGIGHGRNGPHLGHGRPVRPGTVGAPIASGLNAPFGLDVDPSGRVLVAETGFGDENNPAPGQVTAFVRGQRSVLATDAPFLDDVSSDGPGGFAYTVGEPTNTLTRVDRRGRHAVVDLGAYEAAHNPDQVNTYGPRFDLASAAGPACWSTVDPELAQGAAPYTGVVDSDVFRTVPLPDGSRAVADAAGNDVLRVSPSGAVSVIAVLPPNVLHMTRADISGPLTDSGAAFPQCVLDAVPDAGFDFAWEPVPTGLAVGWDGALYVGLLSGGEIPGGAKVMRIDLHSGRVEPFAGGFTSVTDIAFGRANTLYVTELFNDDVVQIPTGWSRGKLVAGTPSTFAGVPMPNGLAAAPDGTVYVSTGSLTPAGQVVPIRP